MSTVFLFCQGHEAQFHPLQLAFPEFKETALFSGPLPRMLLRMRVTAAPVSAIRETIFGRVHYN